MRFREGTTDLDCWRGIVEQNEYNLPEDMRGWRVIDIGTHIGSFTKAAHDRGCRDILAFEASPDNYEVAFENVGKLPGVILVNRAVGRSDARRTDTVRFGGFVPFFDGRTNTGGGDVFAAEGEEGIEVPCTALDDILSVGQVDLMKIDCEGSEWPILYTSALLDRVQRICGEYHSLPNHVEDALDLPWLCDERYLATFLSAQYFRNIEVQPPNQLHAQHHQGQRIGLFFASR